MSDRPQEFVPASPDKQIDPSGRHMNPVLRLLKLYAIALVAVGALIWFPLIGFLLTINTSGLLPALICNLFLIHLTVIVWDKKVSPAWLILPAVCYGTWLGWAFWQNHAAAAEKTRLESENRVTALIPQNVTLVFSEQDFRFALSAKQHLSPSVRVFVGTVELSAIDRKHTHCLLPQPKDPPFIEKMRCPLEPLSQPPANAIVFRVLERPPPEHASPPILWRYALTRNSAATGDDSAVIGHFTWGWFLPPVWAPVFSAGCVAIGYPPWPCFVRPMTHKISVGQNEHSAEHDPRYRDEDKAAMILAEELGLKFVPSMQN